MMLKINSTLSILCAATCRLNYEKTAKRNILVAVIKSTEKVKVAVSEII